MKCKYKLTDRAKSDLKFVLTVGVMWPATVIAIIFGAFAIVVAIAYPFVNTTNNSMLVDISSWSVYLVALVTTIKYWWKWLKENIEECE